MRFHINYWPLLFSLLLVSTPALYAQDGELLESESVPACDSVADDPDADGNGWTPRFFGGHPCQVTGDTKPRPETIERSGTTFRNPMALNYWDANVDFADREIVCTNYHWSDELANYEVENMFYITHQLLPDSELRMGKYQIRVITSDSETLVGDGNWRSTHGRYLSENFYLAPGQPLKMFADPWGEEILFTDRTKGMRFWYEHLQLQGDEVVVDGSKFQECRYTSGGDFLPSGHWDQLPTESGMMIGNGISTVDLLLVKPAIVNPETGELVELQQLSWNPEDDLFHKKISCTDYSWSSGSFQSTYPEADVYLFMPPQPGEKHGNVYVDAREQGVHTLYKWSVENGKLTTTSLFPTEGWYEAVLSESEDIRVWTEDAYDSCIVDRQYTAQDLALTGEISEQSTVEEPPEETINQTAEEATEEQATGPAEQTGTDGLVQLASPSDRGSSTGGGSLSHFILLLLAGGCCVRRRVL